MLQTMVIEDIAAQRESLFMTLYQEAFPAVAKYVSKMGGSFEEAKDIFQDALVIYYEKAVAGKTAHHHSEKAYLLGIAKHLWLKKYQQRRQPLPLNDAVTGITAENTPTPTSAEKLMELLQNTGQKCMQLLRAFYYDKLPLQQIAGLFGFSGVRSATVQKYKCLEKARDIIKEKSLTYEDFLE